jgi:hypothetical protein
MTTGIWKVPAENPAPLPILASLPSVIVVWSLCFNCLRLLYFFSVYLCSVILWQPAVFYIVLVLYLRTHNTLNRTSVKSCKYYSRPDCSFCNNFCALSQFAVQLTIKAVPFTMNCDISVGWKIYCVHFVSQHAYITSILFPVCSSVLLQSSFQKALQTLFKLLLYTEKSDLKNLNSQQ